MSLLVSTLQQLSSLPKKPETTPIADPPEHTPTNSPQVVFNQYVGDTVGNPRSRVHQARAVHDFGLDTGEGRETHGTNQERVVFHRIGLCALITLQHVELLLGDSARLNGCITVLD